MGRGAPWTDRRPTAGVGDQSVHRAGGHLPHPLVAVESERLTADSVPSSLKRTNVTERAARANADRVGHRGGTLPGTTAWVACGRSVASLQPESVEDVTAALTANGYLPDEGLATAIFLAITLHRPLLLEGEAGVGKTEVAKVLAAWTGGELIRLQCYEGIDAAQAVYDWDYARQLLHLRAAEIQRGSPGSFQRRPRGRSLSAPLPHPSGTAALDRAGRGRCRPCC